MRFKVTLPFHIRDADRVVETFVRHLHACMAEKQAEPRMIIMAVIRQTLKDSTSNDADTIFVESLEDSALSKDLTFLSIAMVRTFKELPMHGFMLRTREPLGIAA